MFRRFLLFKCAGRDGEGRRRYLGRIVPLGVGYGRYNWAAGRAIYLGELPVGHKGGQGLAHIPLLLRAQVLRDHLDAHLERGRGGKDAE